MAPSGLQVNRWPHMALTFDTLHPSCCDTMGIYRNMCLLGLVRIRRIVFKSD